MTYKDTLLWFKSRIHKMQKDYEDAISLNRSEHYIKQIEESIQIAEHSIEALEKQIPMKPNVYADGYADGYEVWEEHCPRCDHDFDGSYDKFCKECGQRIDWNEVTE